MRVDFAFIIKNRKNFFNSCLHCDFGYVGVVMSMKLNNEKII